MINDIIKILNLEDFIIDIESTTLLKEKNVFYLSIKLTKLPSYVCENCGCLCTKTHDYIKKTINHGLFSDNKLIIYYYARRIKCGSCGKRFYEHNPFSNKNENISFYTIHKILETLKDFHITFTHVANKYYLSKNQVLVIFDQYVDCHRKTLPEVMCIDEFYLGKKSKQKYAFVMLDFSNSQITDILPTRKKDYLLKYFSSIPKAERQNVKYICMDMYDTYKIVAKYRFPNAKIAVDSFHVIKHINEALIALRIKIMNKFDKNTNSLEANDLYYYMLKRFHYFFVKDYDKIYNGFIKIPKMKTKLKKDQILDYLLSIDETLKKAYYLKEEYRDLNRIAEQNEWSLNQLHQIINKFMNFGFDKFHEVGKMMRRWENEIFNSFARVNDKRLSNGPIEGTNSRIKTILKNACGFRKFSRLRNRIIFSLNKDEPINYTK